MNFESLFIERRKELEDRMKELARDIAAAPDGRLECHRRGKGYRWYRVDGKNHWTIRREDRRLAERLAEKMYRQRKQKEALAELAATSAYLKEIAKTPKRTGDALLSSEGFAELLKPMLGGLPADLKRWSEESYPSNPYAPEQRRVKTSSGRLVRSKSEGFILTALEQNHIPFRYECELRLDGQPVYPDFIIRHPVTGELYLWEHFGMMDDPKYISDMLRKLGRYIAAGWIPMQNLIITTETSDHPLDVSLVMDLIRHFFLS